MDLQLLKQISLSGSLQDLQSKKDKLSNERIKLESKLKSSDDSLIYGIHTGFGPHAFSSNENLNKIQKSLVYHLTVVSVFDPEGNPIQNLNHDEARAVLAARIHSLSLGGSGIRFETLELLNLLLEIDCIPVLPLNGSLSASGDLIPLSYIPLALMGESGWTGKSKNNAPSKFNGKTSGVPGLPWTPSVKEAISLTNGTSFTTALLGLQVLSFRTLLELSLEWLIFLFSYHKVFPSAFFPGLHETKKFEGPKYVASKLYPIVSSNPKLKVNGERIQDQYSVRCIPQILGSLFDELSQITEIVESELNSLSDNPVYFPDLDLFVEGGNFYASQVSFSVDRLQNVMAVYATWIERFLNYLYSPSDNGEYPLMLSPNPGTDAGLSGLGLLATHLTAEIRRESMPSTVQSIPSNGNNQDIVPMGAIGILRNRRTISSLHKLQAVFGYSIFQSSYFSKVTRLPKILEGLKPLTEDRSLYSEIDLLEKRIQNI